MTIQEKAIEQLERISSHLSAIGEKEDYTDIAIHALEQQPNKGKWIEYCYQNLNCSNCGYIVADTDIDEYKYCPNCGAKMEVDE